MGKKETLVIGASIKPYRYSNRAIRKLKAYGHPVIALGKLEGEIAGVKIEKVFPKKATVHTITLYIGVSHQPALYSDILKLKPKRIIFNPGTENSELQKLAAKQGIDTIEDCTLVMLDTGIF